MNPFEWAAAGLVLVMAVCGWVCAREAPMDRVVALQLASAADCLALVCLAQAFGRPIFMDLAVVLAFLSFGGSLVYVRFAERWV